MPPLRDSSGRFVRVVDHGANALLERMRELAAGARVKVGVIGDEASAQHPAGGMTVADIASFHEFGLGNNEERSFIREWADLNEEENRQRLRRAGVEILRRRSSVRAELERFGVYAVGSIQERMASGPAEWKKLAESTMRAKRTDDPTARLIDTGQLRASITAEVVMGGGPEGTG